MEGSKDGNWREEDREVVSTGVFGSGPGVLLGTDVSVGGLARVLAKEVASQVATRVRLRPGERQRARETPTQAGASAQGSGPRRRRRGRGPRLVAQRPAPGPGGREVRAGAADVVAPRGRGPAPRPL